MSGRGILSHGSRLRGTDRVRAEQGSKNSLGEPLKSFTATAMKNSQMARRASEDVRRAIQIAATAPASSRVRFRAELVCCGRAHWCSGPELRLLICDKRGISDEDDD